MNRNTEFTFAAAKKVVVQAAKETPAQMFSPVVAFVRAAVDIANGPKTAQSSSSSSSKPNQKQKAQAKVNSY